MDYSKKIHEIFQKEKQYKNNKYITTYNNDDILLKNCLKLNIRNRITSKEKESFKCHSKCRAFEMMKKYENEIKEFIEANINLKRINEILIKSINLKDSLYLDILKKNKDLKSECNFLNFQIDAKNKYSNHNHEFSCNVSCINKSQPNKNISNFNNSQNINISILNSQTAKNNSISNFNCENFNDNNNKNLDNNLNYENIDINYESDLFKSRLNRNTQANDMNLFNKSSNTRDYDLCNSGSNITKNLNSSLHQQTQDILYNLQYK